MTSNNTKAPTDLELMLYADGELEGEERAAVEAYLARDRAAQQKVMAMGLVGELVRERAEATAQGADDVADRVMAAIASEAKQEAPAKKSAEVIPLARPKHDRGRGLWPVAVIALAAAAGLLLWGRSTTPTRDNDVASSPTPKLTSAREPTPTTAPAKDDFDHGVEVSAVDFGALTGAIFYVPTGPAASETTTVVWLSDDSAGGNE